MAGKTVKGSAERHDTCVHSEACDRAASMHGIQMTHKWLRCDECEVYDSEHCPMSYSGTMRCKGLA